MLVIIGTGLAGYMLAKEWRKFDASTSLTMLTESHGDFYSKPLLSTALTQQKTAEQLALNSPIEMAHQLNALIETDVTVERIDPVEKTIFFSNKTIQYDQLVLACGSSPIHLNFSGNAGYETVSVNNLEDYSYFRAWLLKNHKKQLAILGSGLVGCEFANDLLHANYEVEILSLDHYPLQKLIPETMGRTFQEALSKKGVRWHFGVSAQSIDREKERYRIGLDDGTEVHADGIFSAVGLVANKQLAEKAGLTVNQGIVVDRRLQTSHADIFALGDCAEVLGHVKHYVAPLLQCARTLAKVLVGQDEKVHYPTMPIVIKTPACPLVTCPVPLGVKGEWRYSGDDQHLSALFYDTDEQLRGFTLMGDKVRHKLELAKQLPLLFEV